jgi:hypothetical protein
VTFTGATNRWANGQNGGNTLTATRTDEPADPGIDFLFNINTLSAPTVLSATTNADGTVITITFSKEMVDPTGKHGEFKYQIAGVVGDQAFSTAALNAEDTHSIDLTTFGTAIAPGDEVTVMYTEGTVKAEDHSVLETFFGAQDVENAMPFPVPTVTEISPTSGPVDGNTIVTVKGTGFFKADPVKFGDNAGTALAMNRAGTEITITSPPGAPLTRHVVHVTVKTLGGTSTTSGADQFTYDPAPSVTGITPAIRLNTGSGPVTIIGTDFVNGATVKLTQAGQADILATNVVWVSATQITCDFPITGALAGDWTVIVTNPDGQNSRFGHNNPFQLIALAISNAPSDPSSDPSSSDSGTGDTPGAGTGQSTAPASVGNPVEPEAQGAPSPAAMEAVTAELSVTDQGVVTEATEMQSPDGLATVSIDPGVVALDQAGAPVSSVSIDTLASSEMPDVPQGGAVSFAGIAYELGPNGAQFSPAISITFTAPPGQVGQDYTVRTFDHASGTWQDLPTSYDPQTGMVTAEVSHFCCFALFTKIVTTAPAIAATPAPTQLIPTKIAPPSPTIATTFLGIILWVVNLMISNPILLAGIVILAVGIVLIVWKQRRDQLNYRP